jgi:hypothetical protein
VQALGRFSSTVDRFGFGRRDAGRAAVPSFVSDPNGSGASARNRFGSLLAILALTVCASALTAAPASAAQAIPTMGSVSDVSYASAHVTGEVGPTDPDRETLYGFEYSTDEVNWVRGPEAYARSVPAGEATTTPVSEDLTGLKASTEYFVRLATYDFIDFTELPSPAPYPSFTTLTPTAPTLAIDPPTAVSYTKAQISGTVDPEGGNLDSGGQPLPIAWQLQITRDPLGEGWQLAEAGTIEGPEAESSSPITVPTSGPKLLEGLLNNTEYKFRLLASYAGAEALSSEGSFKTEAVSVPVLSIENADAVSGTSAHFAGTLTPGNADPAFDSNCFFDYVADQQFAIDGFASAQTIACKPSTLSGTAAAPVVADPTGLEPNTTYHLRLRAENQGGPNTAVAASTFTTLALAPKAQTLGAGAIQADSAELAARINPLNSPVTYQFEWGESVVYSSKAPAIAEPLGASDDAFHLVSELITGLSPGTDYHFRIVATNTQTGEVVNGADRNFTSRSVSPPAEKCPNESSRIGPSAALPECRAYEWVTPGLNGATISPYQGVTQPDGGAILFRTIDAAEDAESSASVENFALASRGSSGWSTRTLSPPTPEQIGIFKQTQMQAVSPDFSQSVVLTTQPLAGAGSPKGLNLYLQRADDSYVSLTNTGVEWQPPLTIIPQYSGFAGASKDFSHIFFMPGVKQLPEDPIEVENTYEWIDGDLRLVGILPGESQTPAPGGARLAGGVLPPVSEDGEEALFLEKTGDFSPLYLRIGGEETVEVSRTQRTIGPDPDPKGSLTSVGITADGSEVLFRSRSELTNDANTGESEGVANHQGADLYSFDVDTEVLTDLTVDENPADAATGADVVRVVAATHDASFIYFVARGDLAPGAVSGELNFYVEHEGVIEFIAPALGMFGGTEYENDASVYIYITPDGRHAAFVSKDSLTGYDNENPSTGQPEPEVFKYTYQGPLQCVSCRPDGTPPTGEASLSSSGFKAMPRVLSDDGSRVFFQTNDKLDPRDINGDGGCFVTTQFNPLNVCQDVYEYADGEVHLLSPGEDTPSYLLEATPSGDDVFFATHYELALRGQGPVAAIYDARVNADVPPALLPPECQGENCRGVGSDQAESSSPGSTRLRAPAELVAPKKRIVRARKLQLRLAVPEQGSLTVSGHGLKTGKKDVSAAGPVTLTLALDSSANKARIRKGLFKTRAQVLFRSSSGDLRTGVALEFKAMKQRGRK